MKHIRMKKSDWEKWDTALRSGEYKQCAGELYTPTESGASYCCLGVLQKVLDGRIERVEPRDSVALPSMQWCDTPSVRFSNAQGYDARDPFLSRGEHSASGLNDMDVPFSTLADYIRDEVEFTDA